MRLILIRHADPEYQKDTITARGKREAALLAKRVANWQVDDVYVSPLGRAKATAEPCLRAWGKEATVLDWAKEFYVLVDDGNGGKRIPWDYYPSEWTWISANFRENDWVNLLRMVPVREEYERVCAALDHLLATYGFRRQGRYYQTRRPSEKTVVIFCHFGISMILLSHLLNLPAQALLHGFYLAPTSVTVLSAECRTGDEAYFRAERLGDCAHLIAGGEPISSSGYFAEIMQEPKLFKHNPATKPDKE